MPSKPKKGRRRSGWATDLSATCADGSKLTIKAASTLYNSGVGKLTVHAVHGIALERLQNFLITLPLTCSDTPGRRT